MPRKYAGPLQQNRKSAYVKGSRRNKIVNNYKTNVKASTSRSVIRPQNNVPKQSVIGLRYKQSVDLNNIPVHVAPGGIEESGYGLVINMSDPTSTALLVSSFGQNTQGGSFAFSNTSTTGGQDNLKQALTDSGLFSKYDHFYVKRSVCTVCIRGKPNQYKLGLWLQDQGDGTEASPHYLKTRYPALEGDLYNFAVMSDRASVDLVSESTLKVRHQTAGIKLKSQKIFPNSSGRDCTFKLTYTPKRLGIKDPGDNRDLIGFTSTQNVQENSYAQFVIGKQMFPDPVKNSANSIVDIAIDYEIVACERRITDNDALPRPLPGGVHSGDL